ncbi:hypothetical protein SPRG_18297 [Saprolegnia parasitica CBS 223.65]|uniref:Peptidase M24 domain-containing protein n=1 Tax=Saprolegnia parasitica (strain CBS 223.65) TaxID=695850 RepID=A0A067BDM0_SAPPC|nr:hypothetical protein SPRG_18297 [Saprolegnia parasitica CBS 223.65]KDO16168.1 hypothetical protein SPRG_18297 [Saprolegnia parasitica CBS 223.65]|eukprot:XP_012213125.1 hypothetical protein SPRG_18297 [Saprolegnia parasitica CBS 223.65]
MHFVSLSFETISGSGPNGAIIHYDPKEETCGSVTTDKMYLNDSGAQYLDGTTDVTRTSHFGTPTTHEIYCFTHVLKAHIALATAVFPNDCDGVKLDALTRAPLWRAGMDYRHGTGHGVGAFLNVHEKGVLMSFKLNPTGLLIGENMIVSNEVRCAAVAGGWVSCHVCLARLLRRRQLWHSHRELDGRQEGRRSSDDVWPVLRL